MTPDQIALVQRSFSKVAPISDQAAELFYGRLFTIAPEVEPLFAKADMRAQGKKLMGTLAVVVGGLTDLPAILPAASRLAKLHVSYGVAPAHYASVGAALLWTLEQGLGEDWTPEVAEAWAQAYTTLSSYMISEANSVAA
ncbi:globin family protein [Rhodopseudomonas sp. NSM]|uniref:globin family protein n=1 Tax=Rhodopseudomonas sp. NSM TaxID=3457630 RepID=UPI004035505A